MAKHCEHCKLTYADELASCPHCGAVAEEGVEVLPAAEDEALLVDEEPDAEAEAILLDEEEAGPPAVTGPAAAEEVVDLADVHVQHQEPGATSDVALGHEVPLAQGVSDVALAGEVPSPAEGASDVQLAGEVHLADEALSDVALAHEPPRVGGESDVALGQQPPLAEAVSDVALAGEEILDLGEAPPGHEPAAASGILHLGAAEEPALSVESAGDSAVDLAHPIDVLAEDSGGQPPLVTPASGTSDVGWAELVAADEEVPGASEVVVDSPSDVNLIHEALVEEVPAGAEEVPLAAAVSEEVVAPAEGEEVVAAVEEEESFATLRPEELPTPPAGVDLLAATQVGAGLPSMELEDSVPTADAAESEQLVEVASADEGEATLVPEEAEGEVLDLGTVEEATAAPDAGASGVDLAGTEDALARPGSDLNLVPEAMESGMSQVYLGHSSVPVSGEGSAIDLVEVSTEDAGSAIDLTSVEAGAGTSGSAIDLTDAEVVGEGASGLDLHELGAAEPAADAEDVEEWPTQHFEAPVGTEEEAVAVEEGPPSARDIVEQVESGVDLADAEGPVEGGEEETVSLEGMEQAVGDSAVDLGAPMSEQPEAAPAPAARGGLDSDLLMSAMEEGEEATAVTEEGAATAEVGGEGLLATAEGGEVGEEEPVGVAAEEGEEEVPPGRPAAREGRRGGAMPWVGGWFLGTVLTAGVAAALWFIGMIPERNARPAPGSGRQTAAETPTLESAHTRLSGGDYQEALQMYDALGTANADNPSLLASRGEARWLSALQQLAAENKPLTKEELNKLPNVAKAREDLTKASKSSPDALYWLGQIEELTDGPDAARKTFEQGLQQFPAQKQRFQAALDNLDVSAPTAEAGARLPRPATSPEAYWRALALVALQAGAGTPAPGGETAPAPASPDDEAGYHFWNAVRLAQDNKESNHYDEAIKALKEARTVHERRRFTRSRKAQNPESDPYENIFLRACDELTVYWETRAKLEKAGVLAKDQKATPDMIRKAIDGLAGEHKQVVEKLKAEKYDTKDVAAGLKQLFEDKNKTDTDRKADSKKVTDVLAALKAAGVKADDPVQGVTDLDKAKKAGEKKLEDVLTIVKGAGVKADDPVKGVEDLDKRRKDGEAKLAKVGTIVKDAGINAEDPIRGVEEVVAARDESNHTLDDVRKQLVTHKYLPPSSLRPDVPKGVKQVLHDVDHPVVVALTGLADELSGLGGKVGGEVTQGLNTQARLTAAQANVGILKGQLSERWTPEQMIDVWLVVLRDPAHKGLAPQALRDVQRVLNEKEMPAAVCVKGLAERDQGRFKEARADLKGLANAPGDPDAPWRQVVRTTLDELTEPRVHYVPRLRRLAAEGNWAAALDVANEALKVFPQDGFARDHAALLALRSLVELELARRGARADELLQASRQDAAAAVAAGELVDGKFAEGRLAEAQGDLPAAERSYREAVRAFEAANPEEFRTAHPVGDAAGNRYREALTRVLLEAVRRARPVVPAEAPPPEPKAGTRTGRAGGTGTTTVTRSTGFALGGGSAPQTLLVPFLVLQQGAADEPEAPPIDPRLTEALALADRLIAAGDARGYLLRGEILGRMSRWNEGLKAVDVGVRRLLPAGEADHIAFLLENHPAFQRREGLRPSDPVLAEEYYAAGLHEYFDLHYAKAERNFSDATYYNDQDARYLYFLGLARLAQPGKRDLALEDFRQGGRLEQQGRPSPAAVSAALERVQGPPRHLLNRVREEAIREITSKQP